MAAYAEGLNILSTLMLEAELAKSDADNNAAANPRTIATDFFFPPLADLPKWWSREAVSWPVGCSI